MDDSDFPEFVSGTSRRVDSAYDLNVCYHLVLGQFKWPSEQRAALCIFLQRGDSATYPEALEKGELIQARPLILEEDLEEVLAGIAELRG